MEGACERCGYCEEWWWSLRRLKWWPCLSNGLRLRHVHKPASFVRSPWAITPPKPPLGPEALLLFWELATVSDVAAGETGCVEALGGRFADAVGLPLAQLQRVFEHAVYVGGDIP